MTDKITNLERCKCGHPKYTHNVFTGECEVRTCKCTLYSQEPQQVVCPKCKGSGGYWPEGVTRYPTNDSCPECNGTGRVQPETPDELLTDDWIFLTYKKYKRQPNLLAMPAYEKNIIKHFLFKCHQSEAARIKDLEEFIADLKVDIEELKILNQNNDKVIRADQNKKIGDILQSMLSDFFITIPRGDTIDPQLLSDFIAKLKSPEGEK